MDESLNVNKAAGAPSVLNGRLCAKWRGQATDLREEANRIRRTVKQATGAEERCNVRAEIYDKCADELESA